jgi:hypothetical protein
MAGLYFWHDKVNHKLDEVKSSFIHLLYDEPKYFNYGKWNVLVFPKTGYSINNWCETSEGIICGVGTFGYKGQFYDHALPLILHDFIDGSIDNDGFWGSFIIVILCNGNLTLMRDGAGLSRLYRNQNGDQYSTSFAGLIHCSNTSLTFNRDAATELLTTGVLTGDQTIVNEINRITRVDAVSQFKIIEIFPEELQEPFTRTEALAQQIELTNNYFSRIANDWQNYFNGGVIDVGITGGMDSRLSAALALKTKANIVFHTHWRKEGLKNDDYRYAHIFAEKTGIKLNEQVVKDPFEMSNDEIEVNFDKSYCLSDGVIRPGAYWDEAFSTREYRAGLTPVPYLRFLGFGGEQYRNGERLPMTSKRSLASWIRWEMMYQFAGRYFLSEGEAMRLQNRIEQNLIDLFNNRSPFLNLPNFKNYVRLVQSPSYRSLQASMENRLGFCINPFLDTALSVGSLKAIPFLGKSLSFQLDMIKAISPLAAAIPNGYGFDFSKGEPIHLKAGAVAWQLLPPQIKHPVYAKYKKYNFTGYIPRLAAQHAFVSKLEKIVLQLDLPIDFEKHRLVRSRARLMLNLGYFLLKNASKLKY